MVHADQKRKGRGRSRVLYFFRTPAGVKVGRAALDEDAIRMIEEHNPDIEFDWTRILKGGQEQPPEKDRRPQPARERREGRGQPPVVERRGQPPAQEPAADSVAAPLETAPDVEPGPEHDVEPEVEFPPVPDGPMTAAGERLGSEGLARLRGRYAEMLARITERIADPERQTELKTLAERLNPDAWVTAEDVTAGLDTYEATFESLRGVVGHRRRRRRRRAQPEAE